MWNDEPNRGFDRETFIRERHEPGLPDECIELMGILACGCSDWEIAAALGIPVPRVTYWTSYAINVLFGGWGDTKPTDMALLVWFMEHSDCCVQGWAERIHDTTYARLAYLKREQPGARLDRLAAMHIDFSRLEAGLDHWESLPPSRQRRVPRRCHGPTRQLLGFDPADPEQMAEFVKRVDSERAEETSDGA
ncbi:MAG: hypothetical protein IT303_06010 [Dehalococcoidia bacterium]|nr:hypothetical protein [Dehalococcoidia bacterium]